MRTFVGLIGACLAAAVFAGGAFAHHSGQENVANGRGATAATTTQTVTLFATDCRNFFICLLTPSGTQTTTTTLSERFDFDAHVSSQEVTDPLLAEPHGHMSIDFTQSTRVQVNQNEQLCSQPNVFCFPAGDSDQTSIRTAKATADVLCLTVVNNRATIGGRVTRFEGSFTPTRGLLFTATDNTIAGQQLTPDRFASAFVAEAPQVCPAPSADHPITQGDILVEMN